MASTRKEREARQAHINALVLENGICVKRGEAWVVPYYTASGPSEYAMRLWQVGLWMAPWQVKARSIEQDTGRFAYAVQTAIPDLLGATWPWHSLTQSLRWQIAKAMAKNYNGAPVNGKGSTWLPYDQPSPIWDLAQLPMRPTPVVAPFVGQCDVCGRLVVRQRQQFNLWWADAATLDRQCRATVPDYKGEFPVLGSHTVNGRMEAHSEHTSQAIYQMMVTKHPVQEIDLAPIVAQITGRAKTKFRKALQREQKAAGLR